MFIIIFSLALRSSSVSNHKSDEYQIGIEESQYYDPLHQNDYGDPPTFWVVWVSIICVLAVIMIIYFIYRCFKKSKKNNIADSTLINPEDSYHNAIPPTIPQQTNQEIYQPYQQYYQQPYQNQQPYQQPTENYQQPSRPINVF